MTSGKAMVTSEIAGDPRTASLKYERTVILSPGARLGRQSHDAAGGPKMENPRKWEPLFCRESRRSWASSRFDESRQNVTMLGVERKPRCKTRELPVECVESVRRADRRARSESPCSPPR